MVIQQRTSCYISRKLQSKFLVKFGLGEGTRGWVPFFCLKKPNFAALREYYDVRPDYTLYSLFFCRFY